MVILRYYSLPLNGSNQSKMKYSNAELIQLRDFYQSRLLQNTIPFWFPRSYDREFGGFLLMRDEDGMAGRGPNGI